MTDNLDFLFNPVYANLELTSLVNLKELTHEDLIEDVIDEIVNFSQNIRIYRLLDLFKSPLQTKCKKYL